jgi:hypothetical protein
MTLKLLTEAGDCLVAESIAGLTGASSLNDTTSTPLIKETFTTTPLTRNWLAGSGWAHNSGNGNMEAV